MSKFVRIVVYNMMEIKLKNINLDNVFSIIQRSYKVERHVDFFVWMQNCVAEVIPHGLVLAAWGDFGDSPTGLKLNYDVASNVSGVSTQDIWKVSDEVDACVAHLHSLWLKNNRHWFTVNHLNELASDLNFKSIFPDALNETQSMLVYGVSDLRGKSECLYIFFGSQSVFEVNGDLLSLIMPHVDNTLRKIKYLEPSDVNSSSKDVNLSGLSERELEVIDWIKSGKTNQEIGLILNISQNTVKSHLKRIFQKLNVSKRAQAVALLARTYSTKFKSMHLPERNKS